MQLNFKKAIIIGETRLCTQCAEHLINNNWKIIKVMSDDKTVIDWSNNHSIEVLPTAELNTIKENNFYLFSIINPSLISKSFLTNKNILLALNYHDSPLPKYAGINSTTWAVLNNEQTHGVTLHQITTGIDDGDIAAQSIINIDKDETAISLNLKCSEQLLLLFKEVIAKIEMGTLAFFKQNLSERTYYGSKHIPINYGIVNGVENLETLSRLTRSLTFGVGYDNQVATVKVFLNEQFYIAENFNAKLIQDNYTPDNHTVLFNTVRDIYGNKTDLKITCQDIAIAYMLTNDDLQYLSNIKTLERRHKKQISEFLNNSEVSTKVLEHILNESDDKKHTQEITIPNNINATTALTLVYLVLVRFFYDSNFIVSLYISDDPSVSAKLCGLVENRNFIYVNSNILSNGFTYLENHLAQLQKNCHTITKDFGYRYGLQLSTDIAITVGKVERIDKHKIIIKIENSKIIIEGSIVYKLQINSIAESIEAVLSKNIQRDMANKDLQHINILNDTRYQQIVYEFNRTEKNYPRDKTIHQLFEEQVLKTPNNIAVVYEDTKLTYQELNNKANQLANYLLQNYDIKPDDLIALCLDRNEQMLVAILGVLKSGGAYVPLDPNYPNRRIGYILSDTKTKVVLTNDVHTSKIQHIIKQAAEKEKTGVLAIDSKETQINLTKQKRVNPVTQTTNNNLIYVIYTSGTTGNPKGVLVEHRSVANYIACLINYNRLNGKSIGSQYAAFSFDALVIEIYPIFLSGGSLHIVLEQDRLDPIKINDFFQKNHVTYAFLPPKIAELFFELKNNSLIHLLVGGEKLEKFIKQTYLVLNAYGPTEATVQATNFIVNKSYNNIPIGKPINNVKCYIVDNNLSILPIGAIGELMIGGECLARGYLNNPDLTAEKFISNPFQIEEEKSQNKNGKLYKTGDLVRWLPDGNIEYIGRNDSQIKIRGYRIELGEIENKLTSYPGIKQGVAVVMDSADSKYIALYYVADNKIDESLIAAYLSKQLPNYMLPSSIVYLKKLPLTANGKINHAALPKPEFTNKSNYVAPKTELEIKICEIYSEILGLSAIEISTRDSFLNLGGNSLTAIRLTSAINQQLKSNIRIIDILDNGSIENLAKLISSKSDKFIYQDYVITSTNAANLYEPFELNNIQQAYYFGRFGNFTLGNTSAHIYTEYEFKFLDVVKLEKALNKLIARHYNLRMIFENGKQRYVEKYPYYQVKFYKLSDISGLENLREQYSHKVYTIDQLWLFDIFVSSFENKYILHFSLDALIMDAYSVWIFFDELSKLYQDLLCELPKLNINYRDYIKQSILIRQSDLFIKAKEYWLNKIDDYNFTLSLPLQKQPNTITYPRFARVCKELDAEIWKKITAKAKHYGIGQTIAILHIYGYVLSYWSNQSKLCVNMTLFNRLPLHKQTNNLVGDFTVLELFNYVNYEPGVDLLALFKGTYNQLWNDIENNLFDGLDFQRLIRDKLSLSLHDKIIAPVVLTSIFGTNHEKILDESCDGINYEITQTPQVWLDNKAYERNGKLVAEWDYVEELFDRKTIEAMHEHYFDLIKYLADANWAEDTLPVLELPKPDQEIVERANTATQPSSEDTLFGRYESLVISSDFGEEIAVIDCGNDNKKHKYRDLLEDSGVTARHILATVNENNLSGKNPAVDTKLIAVLSGKGYNQVLSTVSIMKAGFGYLPLNVYWPLARIEEILDQAGAHIILISRIEYANYELRHKLAIKYQLLVIEEILEFFSGNQSKRNDLLKTILPKVKADDVAYVIFTSGSTGRPKGVTITHRGALNTIDAINNKFNITKQDNILAISELSFDLSVYDIFGLLAVGGKIAFPAQHRTKEPKYWLELIKHHKITIWNTVPQLAGLLIDEADSANDFDISFLRLFLLSGDWLPTKLPDRIKKYCNQAKVFSLGGATEGSIWSIWYEIDKVDPEWSSIPYGIAMPNQKMYVLNYAYQHCPIGVVGEIYIGGAGVALNYWQDQSRTEASFINHAQLGRIYKTGDLGKWSSNGYIEFIGRQDNQTKIRGYRIELGEIEKKLITCPGIIQAVVLVKEHVNRGKYLVAYYVSSSKLDDEFIKDNLRKKLPDYMIPNILVHLMQLPLTSNGKLDLAVLNELANSQATNVADYIAPSNELEYKICVIYAEVLGLPVNQISVNDDFFKWGGDSISAIRTVSKLQQYIKINLSDLFQLKTPLKIAQQLPVTNDDFNLHQKLEQIKSTYQIQKVAEADIAIIALKRNKYLQENNQIILKQQFKNIHNVLLTGATGFLGCNILHQLLTTTNYKIYLLIRGDSNEHVYDRINKKFNFYFDTDLHNYKNKIVVLKSNLELPNLGLEVTQYEDLIASIDSIIHTAALVKHYGSYDAFYQANVQTTINLLELSKLTKTKDFHYISTNGIFLEGYVPNYNHHIFTEDDTPDILSERSSLYLKTKYEGEIITSDYRQYGITSNIYRVGNLTAHSISYRNQENIDENGFFHCVRTMLDLGATAKEFSLVEMSPVDCTALGIIKIFNQTHLSNQTYHVFNPNLCDLQELFSAYDKLHIKELKVDKFIDMILKKLDNSAYNKQIELFMLHKQLLQNTSYKNLTKIEILQNKTSAILNHLGFSWPKITKEMLSEIIKIIFPSTYMEL